MAIDPGKKINMRTTFKENIRSYIQHIREENPAEKQLLKTLSARESSLEDIL